MASDLRPGKETGYRTIAFILLRFSLPMILSGILQQLYLWADAFIVGHFIGEDALAAVGVTGNITSCITLLIVGFTTGLTVIAAQKYGSGDNNTVRKLFTGFFVLFTSAVILLSAAGSLFSSQLLYLLDAPDNIFDYANSYLQIMFIGIPFLGVYNLYAAILRAVGNTKSSFFAIIISSVTNVALDLWFVLGFRMGVVGAALATTLSQTAMAAFLAVYAAKKYEIFRFSRHTKPIEWRTIMLGCRYALPLMIQQGTTAIGNMVLLGFMNGFGSHTVAAVTSAYRVDSILLYPLFNLGASISTKVAQSKGARHHEKMRKFSQVGTVLCIILAVLLTLIMFNFGGYIIRIFGVEQEAAEIGTRFFQSVAVYYLAFGFVSAFRGIVEGNGKVLYSTIIGIAGIIARIILSYALAGLLDNMVIAHAEGLAYIFMVLCYAACVIKIRQSKVQ